MASPILYIVAHDIRSAHNVGSLIRTAEGLGVDKLFLTGYTPYPTSSDDVRLPHIAAKLDKQIKKTSLGAELTLDWQYKNDPVVLLKELKDQEFELIALEQGAESIKINRYKPKEKVTLVLGSEVTGVNLQLLKACDYLLEIPMIGKKESFNVVQAAAMAAFYIKLLT